MKKKNVIVTAFTFVIGILLALPVFAKVDMDAIELNVEEIHALIKDGNVNKRDRKGRTSLINAVRNYKVKEIIELLKNKADVSLHDDKGYTALMYAAENGYTEIAHLLISYGANPNQKTWVNRLPLFLALENDKIETADLLVEKGAKVDDFYLIVLVRENDKLNSVKFLVEHGADVNAPVGLNNSTALMNVKEVEVAEYLLNNGADIDAVDLYNETALSYACSHFRKEVVEKLLENGITERDKEKLYFYVENLVNFWTGGTDSQRAKIMEILLDVAEKENIKDTRGVITYLVDLAKEKGYTKVSGILEKHLNLAN